jgi:SAM-dependent methyltransferase
MDTLTSYREEPSPAPWSGKDLEALPGYWLLGSLGKKVLRPGGIALSRRMIEALQIGREDQVVEYAPGLGITAMLTLDYNPAAYTAIEKDPRAAALLRLRLEERARISAGSSGEYRCIEADASAGIDLPASSATVVYGESMLTIHSPEAKWRILKDVYSLLKSGGRFGFQEISLHPETIDQEKADTIRREVMHAVRHPAWPLSVGTWHTLIREAGFEIVTEMREPVQLLELERLIDDEGQNGTLNFLWNVQEDPVASRRIQEIRSVFRRHAGNLCALCMVARKK